MNGSEIKMAERVGRVVIEKVAKYVDSDMHTYYGLKEPVELAYHGSGIGIGSADCGPMHIQSVCEGDTARIRIDAFPAETKYWNGPNIIPDDWQDGSLEGSLVHDLIWTFAGDLSKRLGISPRALLKWSNGILVATWKGYAAQKYPESKLVNTKTWIGYQLCNVGIWLKLHGIRFGVVALVAGACLLTGCAGCSSPPEWTLDPDAPEISPAEGTSK